MKVLSVIPARGGSKRLPGKNIMEIGGRPMITHTIGHAQAAETVDRVVVSTDDSEIAEVSAAAGAEVVERPEDISGDTAAIEDSIRHVVETLREKDGYEPEIVVLMQANIVYRPPGLVDEVVKKLADDDSLDSVATCYEVNQRPEWMKTIKDGVLAPVTDCDSFRQQELPDYYLLDGAAAAVRTRVLMETRGIRGVHKYMGNRMGYVVQDRRFGVEVDHREDVAAAEILLRYMQDKDI